jgi:hypothetical protein
METEKEIQCPRWPKCGAALVRDSWAKDIYPYGDKRRNFIQEFCQSKDYERCDHFHIKG